MVGTITRSIFTLMASSLAGVSSEKKVNGCLLATNALILSLAVDAVSVEIFVSLLCLIRHREDRIALSCV